MGRGDLARSQATAPPPASPEPATAGSLNLGTEGTSVGSAGTAVSGAATGGAALAAVVATEAAGKVSDGTHRASDSATRTATGLLERDPDRPMRGPSATSNDQGDSS